MCMGPSYGGLHSWKIPFDINKLYYLLDKKLSSYTAYVWMAD